MAESGFDTENWPSSICSNRHGYRTSPTYGEDYIPDTMKFRLSLRIPELFSTSPIVKCDMSDLGSVQAFYWKLLGQKITLMWDDLPPVECFDETQPRSKGFCNFRSLDFVNLMTYDLYSYAPYDKLTGYNSPLYPNSWQTRIVSIAGNVVGMSINTVSYPPPKAKQTKQTTHKKQNNKTKTQKHTQNTKKQKSPKQQ